MIASRMKLYVVRDLQDGAVLFVSDKKDEAEFELTCYLGTHAIGDDDEEIPTLPVLECYAARIGRMLSTTDAGIVEKRVERRRVLEQAEIDQLSATIRDMRPGKGSAE